MPNRNYLKGIRLERKVVNKARKDGFIAFRSAGSHSPIDVVIIDTKNKIIEFIQCKATNYLSPKEIKKLDKIFKNNGIYAVQFRLCVGYARPK